MVRTLLGTQIVPRVFVVFLGPSGMVSALRLYHDYFFHRVPPRLRRLPANLMLHRTGLNPRAVHRGFVVDKVTLGQYVGFPRQYHSIGASYRPHNFNH